MEKSPRHEAALAYVQAGIPVIPIKPNSKEPALKWKTDRLRDEWAVDAWWSSEDWNLAIVPEDAGWCVIDLDGEEGQKTWEHYDEDPTRTVWTPSGGRHLYYRGSLKTSVRKFGPGVDTRGQDSYVLVPPSVINGKEYRRDVRLADARPLPQWIADRINIEREHAKAADFEYDTPENVERARAYLRTRCPIGADEPGDDYATACTLLDLGISIAMGRKLAEEFGGDGDYAETNLEHAYEYRQNEPGAFAAGLHTSDLAASALRDPEAAKARLAREEADAERASRYKLWKPTELAEMPEPTFWDADKLLPRQDGGSIAVLYGRRGSHKTNVVLVKMLEAIKTEKARVLYAAGEGAYGVGTLRLPKQAEQAGMPLAELNSYLAVMRAVPPLNNKEEVDAFTQAAKAFAPDIVVIDTLTAASAGVEENSSLRGDYLSDVGAVGFIKRSLNALVLVTAHEGKTDGRGVRGHSGQEDNADVLLELRYDKKVGGLELYVEKMRDWFDDRSVYYAVNQDGRIPIPRPISETEYRELKKDAKSDELTPLQIAVESRLRDAGPRVTFTHGELVKLLNPDQATHQSLLNQLQNACKTTSTLFAWSSRWRRMTSKGMHWACDKDLNGLVEPSKG